jgi:hypothetical protein
VCVCVRERERYREKERALLLMYEFIIDGRRGVWYIREGGEMHKYFWLGNSKEREHLGDTGVDGRIIL